MPSPGPSTLSLIAAGLYALVVLSCLTAAGTAGAKRQQSVHWQSWTALAVLFAMLAILRVVSFEELLRDELRQFLLATGSYEERRGIQGPIVLAIVVLAGSAGFFWIYRRFRAARGRRNVTVILAQAAGLAMVGLVALRTVSFSALDSLLFGPLKLNWIGDIGASVLVAGCAVYYVSIVSAAKTRGPAR